MPDQFVRQYQFGSIASVLDAGYFEEINTFVDAVLGEKTWPQSYALCQESTATLAAAERSSVTGRWVKVDPNAEPDRSPPRQS
jgi:predicted dehydrogenase